MYRKKVLNPSVFFIGGSNNVLKMGREGEEVVGWKPVAVLRHRDMIDFHTQPISGKNSRLQLKNL